MLWKRGLAVGLCLVLAMSLVACGDDDADESAASGGAAAEDASSGAGAGATEGPGTPEPQPLAEETSVTIVPVVPIETFAPAYLAEYFGEFDKENLDVTIQTLPASDTFVAMLRGDSQLTLTGINAAFFNLAAGGTDVRWIGNINQQAEESHEGLYVRKELFGEDGEIDPERVPGMQIALGTAGIAVAAAWPVSQWLEDNGSDISEVTLPAIGGNDIVVALEQGAVDAGYVLTPAWQAIEESGCCELVTPLPPMSPSAYSMTADFMQDEPETARAIMRALARTVRTYLQGDYHADPDVVAALSETLQVPEDVITTTPSLVFDPDIGVPDVMLDQIESFQEMWIDAGVLEYGEPIAADDVVDTTVVDDVLEGK